MTTVCRSVADRREAMNTTLENGGVSIVERRDCFAIAYDCQKENLMEEEGGANVKTGHSILRRRHSVSPAHFRNTHAKLYQ